MTILDLQEAGIVFQGPVRVSTIEEGTGERILFYDTLYAGFDAAYDASGELDTSWLSMTVTYIFVGSGDGVLHIEVE